MSAVRVLAGLAAVGAAVAMKKMSPEKHDIDMVDPALHHPIMRMPFRVTNRRELELVRRMPLPKSESLPADVVIADRTIGNHAGVADPLPVRVIEPSHRSQPSGALLWIHGGGMIMGSPEQDDAMLGQIADELGILIVAARYRFAPEDPYPAGLDDCVNALRWLSDSAEELGVDPRRIAVGGASAGGGLAAAVALRSRDRNGTPVCFQLLNYPMIDDRTVLRSDHGGTGKFVWTPDSNRFGWTSYLGAPPVEDDDRIYAAPARATDLAGLPPAWIGVGELDLFHDEDVAYAERLKAAGVPCELLVEPGMYHGADGIRNEAPRMVAYRKSMIAALGKAVASPVAV